MVTRAHQHQRQWTCPQTGKEGSHHSTISYPQQVEHRNTLYTTANVSRWTTGPMTQSEHSSFYTCQKPKPRDHVSSLKCRDFRLYTRHIMAHAYCSREKKYLLYSWTAVHWKIFRCSYHQTPPAHCREIQISWRRLHNL